MFSRSFLFNSRYRATSVGFRNVEIIFRGSNLTWGLGAFVRAINKQFLFGKGGGAFTNFPLDLCRWNLSRRLNGKLPTFSREEWPKWGRFSAYQILPAPKFSSAKKSGCFATSAKEYTKNRQFGIMN